MGAGRKQNGDRTTGKSKEPKKGPPPVRKKPKEGLIKSIRGFFRGVGQELKKVHWPTRREVAIYTGVVLVVVAFIAVILMVADLVLGQVMNRVLG